MVDLPFILRRKKARLGLLALAALLAGCSHYQVGTEGRLGFSTLYVAPVVNKTVLPQATAAISTAIRDALEKDGRLSLATSGQAADVTLSIILVTYRRDVAAVREADTGLASKFAVTLAATCTLRDNRSNRAYFESRPLTVERDVYTDSGQPWSPLAGDQLQAEYNNVPLLAASLADRVAHTVLDVW